MPLLKLYLVRLVRIVARGDDGLTVVHVENVDIFGHLCPSTSLRFGSLFAFAENVYAVAVL